MTVILKVSQVHPYVLSEIYARHCGKTKVEYDTVPPAEAGGRGHITRALQAKERSLNFILRKIGRCGSKPPPSFSRVEGMEACEDRIHCFSCCQINCHLTGSLSPSKRGLRDSKTQTEAGRTVKKVNMGFSMTGLALSVSASMSERLAEPPDHLKLQGCRINAPSKHRSTWQPRACCQEARGQDFFPTEISPCQSKYSQRTTQKIGLFAISEADDTSLPARGKSHTTRT